MIRDKPFIWVTWLKGLMAGDNQCEWQIWYKVHNQGYEKMPQDFDSVEWNLNHTRLLRNTRNRWDDGPWHMTIEGQNSFKIKWPFYDGDGAWNGEAIISGKPDLIARTGDGSMAVIIDAKTGKPRTADRVQVLLYMYLYPLGTGDPAEFQGELQYPTHQDRIPASMLTDQFKETFDYWMNIILATNEPKPIPSKQECDWCDIADCSVRFKE